MRLYPQTAPQSASRFRCRLMHARARAAHAACLAPDHLVGQKMSIEDDPKKPRHMMPKRRRSGIELGRRICEGTTSSRWRKNTSRSRGRWSASGGSSSRRNSAGRPAAASAVQAAMRLICRISISVAFLPQKIAPARLRVRSSTRGKSGERRGSKISYRYHVYVCVVSFTGFGPKADFYHTYWSVGVPR